MLYQSIWPFSNEKPDDVDDDDDKMQVNYPTRLVNVILVLSELKTLSLLDKLYILVIRYEDRALWLMKITVYHSQFHLVV